MIWKVSEHATKASIRHQRRHKQLKKKQSYADPTPSRRSLLPSQNITESLCPRRLYTATRAARCQPGLEFVEGQVEQQQEKAQYRAGQQSHGTFVAETVKHGVAGNRKMAGAFTYRPDYSKEKKRRFTR